MAILKQAKNIFINVRESYTVTAGELLEQAAGALNVESLKEDLFLNSGSSVKIKGKEGIEFTDYTPPKPEVVESEYKLESTFALEQLFAFAQKDSMAMFCFWMTDIFGGDISIKAYEQLYKDASDKKEDLNPKITVAVAVPGKGAAYVSAPDSPFKNHIVVSEGFIQSALAGNRDSQLLLAALVEEFGHHLDYLLRFKYSDAGGDAEGDEGAKYTARLNRKYKKYLIDPFEKKTQSYATATIEGAQKELIWDFSDINELLKEYVDNRVEKDDHYFAGYEFFGAGLGKRLEGFGHQTIEQVALKGIFDEKIQLKIYFGNWLRDFSQFVDPVVVRPMANSLDRISNEFKKKQNKGQDESTWTQIKAILKENKVTVKDIRTLNLPITEGRLKWGATAFSPVKLSRAGITTLVELLAVKEFGNVVATDPKAPVDYMRYFKKFRKEFLEITPEVLGVYRPEEHMDNPASLFPAAGVQANLNHELDPAFVPDPVMGQYQNSAFGTKNYIRGNGPTPFPSAYDCFLKFLNRALTKGPTMKGYVDLGAALHVLEDLYAHSNFCELAVMKVYDPEVFPWDNMPASCKKVRLKDQKADAASNRHVGGLSVIVNRNKVRFDTLINPELHPEGLKKFLLQDSKRKPEDFYSTLPDSSTLNRGLYYSHAECAPLLTGSFGMLDTFASILPKINSKIFSIDVESIENTQEGERTFTDALCYEILRDISQAQDADEKERNPAYKGSGDGFYAEAFQKYLLMRDAWVKKRVFDYSYADLFSAFGVLEYVKSYIDAVMNFKRHIICLAMLNLIDDLQTGFMDQLQYLEDGTWHINSFGPTHTQLAKDNGRQPLHMLAIELAEAAVVKISYQVDLYWKGDHTAKAKIMEHANEFFQHPVQTAWADKIVYKWCKSGLNSVSVQIAHEASTVLYGIFMGIIAVQEMMDELYTMNYWNARERITDSENEFNIINQKQVAQWYRVRRKLFDVWKSDKYAEYFRISGVSEELRKNDILERLQKEELKSGENKTEEKPIENPNL